MKTVKAHIIKFTAIAISVMYIFMPLHKEVKYVLHSISHALEMPDNLISHHHNENLNYKFKASTNRYHEHNILDLLDGLSDANSNTKNQNLPNVVDIKIDKHFHNSKFNIQELTVTKSSPVIDSYKEKVKALFYVKLKIPPQKYS
ncbi:hypothetical protein [Hwangdonia seohaensis]|uniref:Uncharacterized protein n=1 Tax=Hwangdonia seohaensis TaxID=1240727 RepID=A0ABW3RAK2_9FLAO|nr:hypothetical protein [Hwangdonia seohaensis]